MTRTITILTTLLLMSLITACVNRGHGLHNFGVVEVGSLYRGAAPESKMAIHTLRTLGINTVVDLRGASEIDQRESEWCEDYGIQYFAIQLNGLTAVPQSKLDEFMHVMHTRINPVFVHCVYGSDRTSVACAWYQRHTGRTLKTILQEADAYGLLVPAMKHQIEEMKP